MDIELVGNEHFGFAQCKNPFRAGVGLDKALDMADKTCAEPVEASASVRVGPRLGVSISPVATMKLAIRHSVP